jgi:hypothetical protein
MDKSLRVDVAFRDEAPEEVISVLNELGAHDVEEVRQRGLTGFEFVIVCILVSQALANLVIRLLPLWKCGVVVDARGSRVVTEKNCDLPRGRVLVIKSDGTASELHEPSELEIQSLIGDVGSESS